jgi:general stress protein YciG
MRKKNQENKVGIFSLTFEERSKNSSKTALKNVENKVGIFSQTKEELIENAKKGAKKCKELGVGIYSQTKEQMKENGRKTGSQKWMCLETGFITAPGALSSYQKARGIDTSKRIRIS